MLLTLLHIPIDIGMYCSNIYVFAIFKDEESFLQALAMSDIFLSKLGVTRENVDDSAGAAQVIYRSLFSTLF